MKEQNIEAAQEAVEELELLQVDFQLTRDLFEIISQETNKTHPSNDEAQYVYRRLLTLNEVFFERIHEENERFKELFNRLFKAIG